PVLDVVQVEFDALFHFVDAIGLATPAIDLRPAGDAGLDLVALHVLVDEVPVLLIVSDRMRSGPDNGHAPLQHIDELWQFIQAGTAQERTEAGDAWVVAPRLDQGPGLLGVLHHGSELVDLDRLPVPAVAPLFE